MLEAACTVRSVSECLVCVESSSVFQCKTWRSRSHNIADEDILNVQTMERKRYRKRDRELGDSTHETKQPSVSGPISSLLSKHITPQQTTTTAAHQHNNCPACVHPLCTTCDSSQLIHFVKNQLENFNSNNKSQTEPYVSGRLVIYNIRWLFDVVSDLNPMQICISVCFLLSDNRTSMTFDRGSQHVEQQSIAVLWVRLYSRLKVMTEKVRRGCNIHVQHLLLELNKMNMCIYATTNVFFPSRLLIICQMWQAIADQHWKIWICLLK